MVKIIQGLQKDDLRWQRRQRKSYDSEIAIFLAKPRFANPMLVSARIVRTFEEAWPSRGETTTCGKPFIRLSSSRAPS